MMICCFLNIIEITTPLIAFTFDNTGTASFGFECFIGSMFRGVKTSPTFYTDRNFIANVTIIM